MIKDRAKKIKLLIMDVDGVLTDGRIIYTDSGDQMKFFNVLDGFGLSMLPQAGIKTAILTAKKSDVVIRRAKDMRITRVYLNAAKKLKVYKKILKEFNVDKEEVCYIGDDLADLSVLMNVGLAASVPNAVAEVKKAAHYVTKRPGGRGAVREVIEIILKSQKKWDSLLKKVL